MDHVHAFNKTSNQVFKVCYKINHEHFSCNMSQKLKQNQFKNKSFECWNMFVVNVMTYIYGDKTHELRTNVTHESKSANRGK